MPKKSKRIVLPTPIGGGAWKNDFDFAEFDYKHLNWIELDENIHRHCRYEQKQGWFYCANRDMHGNKCIQFLKPSVDGLHCRTMPYLMDWMENAQFVRTKPIDVKASSSKVASPCPQLI